MSAGVQECEDGNGKVIFHTCCKVKVTCHGHSSHVDLHTEMMHCKIKVLIQRYDFDN